MTRKTYVYLLPSDFSSTFFLLISDCNVFADWLKDFLLLMTELSSSVEASAP